MAYQKTIRATVTALFTTLLVTWAHASVPSPFEHLAGATEERGRDFFTRRPVVSELSRIQRVIRDVNQGRISIEQAMRELPRGVTLEEESQVLITNLYAPSTIPFGQLEPSGLLGRWVLRVSNTRIWDEILIALSYDISLPDFLTASKIHRLVLVGAGENHLNLVPNVQRVPTPYSPLIETHVVTFDEHHLARVAGGLTTAITPNSIALFNTIMDWLWQFRWLPNGGHRLMPESPTAGSARRAGLASLGFQQVEQMLPTAYHGKSGFEQYLLVLGAMGYRFNPSAENMGYVSPIDDEQERSAYWQTLVTTFAPPIPRRELLSQAETELLRLHYERIAAALALLGRRNELPAVRMVPTSPSQYLSLEGGVSSHVGLSAIESFREVFGGMRMIQSRALDPRLSLPRLMRLPIPQLYFFKDVLSRASAIGGGEALEEALREGRRVQWNYSDAHLRCYQLFTSSRAEARPRRRR